MRLLRALSLLALLAPLACSKSKQTPEQQVEAAVDKMEAAVEAKDLGAIKEMMSQSYKDQGGMSRKDVVSGLKYQFFRRQSIHLLVRIQELEMLTPTLAKTQLLVAAGATEMKEVSALEKVSADMLKLDVTWTREDDAWKVQKSSYKRAGLADFVD